MIKPSITKMDELNKITWKVGLAMSAAIVMLFFSIFRVSNTTTLVILINLAVIVLISVLTTSWLRYLALLVLAGILAAELLVRHEGGGTYVFFVLVRFVVTGLLMTYFTTLLAKTARSLYINVENLAEDRRKALAESQKWLSQLDALLEVINAISTKSRLQDVLDAGLEETREVFKADSGLVYRISRKTRKLEIMSSFGYAPELLEKMKTKGVTYASSCEAYSRQEVVTVENLATDNKCPNLAKVNSGSSICLPIASKNRVWGVLHLRRRFPAAFAAEDIQLAQAIAYQFALAMQRAYLFDEVNLLAITDPVTGLFNHRKMSRDLKREVVRSKRYRHPFSYIMVDIDHFKDFNDLYGHQAGDSLLHMVARSLETGRREVDRVYRYGGEEFSILLPETEIQEAFEVAEKLRKQIESMEVEVEDFAEPLSVTVSMGVASYPDDGAGPEVIVTSADSAMYAAKESGRNRVVCYGNIPENSQVKIKKDV